MLIDVARRSVPRSLGAMRFRGAVALAIALWPLLTFAQEPAGAEFRANTFTTGVQNAASVARQPDGRFAVAWGSPNQDGNSVGVFAQVYDAAGAPAGAELRVNSFTTGPQSDAAVAAAANGEFVVVWSGSGPGDAAGVFGQRISALGAPVGAEFQVNTYVTGNQASARVAGSPGGFVVVWDSAGQDGQLDGIFGRCFTPDGVPAGPEFQVNAYTTQYQYLPNVAMNAAGSFVVVWMDHPRRRSYGRIYGPGCAPATGELELLPSLLPAVGIDAAGNFVVAGIQPFTGAGYDILGRRFSSGGTPDPLAFRVNTYTTGFQLWPGVAMEPGGDFVVAWETYSLTSGQVEESSARAYRANGTPAGPELVVNTYTTGPQSGPAIAIDEDGNFVVAWTSASDGNGTGIDAQRFLAPDVVFADGFEGGTLVAWSFAATDSGDLSVNPSAAMAGTGQGLQGTVDDTAGLFVQDDAPSDEDRYRARFYFDPHGFDPGTTQSHLRTRILIGFEEAPNRRLFALVLRLLNGQYALMGRARRDDNVQVNTGFFPISDGPHYVELDWRRASGPDAVDGSFQMSIDGTPVSTLTGLDNSVSAVDFIRLGALSVKTGATGTMYWDEFVSHRRSPIGPVP